MNFHRFLDTVSSDSFTWNADSKVFVCEASDIGYGRTINDRPIYTDACDTGFQMISAKTGNKVIFYLEGEDKDSDGDIAGWRFKVIPEHVAKNPALKDVGVLIIND